MIVPWLRGFLSFQRAPLTWIIIALNCFLFVLTFQPDQVQSRASDEDFLTVTGKLYEQFQKPGRLKSQISSVDKYMMTGMKALRDPAFIAQAPSFRFNGDQIQIDQWRERMSEYIKYHERRASHIFGLYSYESSPLTWITYQFSHAGIFHLTSNMILMFIFGGALEEILGSVGLALMYVAGGIAGALGFIILSGGSAAPMVGASASISAVMACYAGLEKRKRVPFFYFVSPMPGFYGLIWLQTWLIYPLSFLTDLASLISTPVEVGGGVATSAHIGGALFGAAAGWALGKYRKSVAAQVTT